MTRSRGEKFYVIHSKAEERRNEFIGKPKPGITICPECRAVFFEKHWHHADAAPYRRADTKGKEVHYARCPACKMAKDHTYGGLLKITGVPAAQESEMMNLILNFVNRAYKRNCQHRLLRFRRVGRRGAYTFEFSDNQLAVRLARALQKRFKKVAVTVRYPHEPLKVSEVTLSFS